MAGLRRLKNVPRTLNGDLRGGRGANGKPATTLEEKMHHPRSEETQPSQDN